MGKKIRLYWWSEIFIQKKPRENYGDLLGKYLVEQLSGKKAVWVKAPKFNVLNYFQPLYVTIGSVLAHINTYCIVWGSGINDKKEQVAAATFLAVRGPLSRKRLLELGHECPEVYGDPALLLPLYYHPQIEKSYALGIIPHINDLKQVKECYQGHSHIKIIDFNTNDVEKTTNEILSCESILSSSLHGIIVAHAYAIPAIQVQFSDRIFGDGVKYHDYFLSVGLDTYLPEPMHSSVSLEEGVAIAKKHTNSLPQTAHIAQLQKDLLAVCPFKTIDL
ncbi:polysaccharide pyruvyl transferase family protein [Nonlabens sp. MB-3u-79]|uniref:polysaccharide pyruvyl transferase family protein n=1 Tax=Nonlabens sp. MB-3u-79 TaxID=2058134 RepID=UPI000C305C78|nr:polysaccharide pyruvyl transferase family protein [Nonlabens sp. MB-3u-79]AUC78008.1 polysaccharide pyruvyl transferase family protein [Nonlabens sp. MB-3u-79]